MGAPARPRSLHRRRRGAALAWLLAGSVLAASPLLAAAGDDEPAGTPDLRFRATDDRYEPAAKGDTVELELKNRGDADLEGTLRLAITDARGKAWFQREETLQLDEGEEATFAWDGKGRDGAWAPNGTYHAEVQFPAPSEPLRATFTLGKDPKPPKGDAQPQPDPGAGSADPEPAQGPGAGHDGAAGSGQGAAIRFATGAPRYAPGSAVTLLARNAGAEAADGQALVEVATAAGTVVWSATARLRLGPGAEHAFLWDPAGPGEAPAQPGRYVATLVFPGDAPPRRAAFVLDAPRASLAIAADRAAYAPGDEVALTLRNAGDAASGAALRLAVEDAEGLAVLDVALPPIPPGGAHEHRWLLEGPGGGPARPGAHTARVVEGNEALAEARFHVAFPPAAPPCLPAGPGGLAVCTAQRAHGPGEEVAVHVVHADPAHLVGALDLRIATPDLRTVRTLVAGLGLRVAPGGAGAAFVWDQSTDAGAPADPGCYLAVASFAGRRAAGAFALGDACVPAAPPALPGPAAGGPGAAAAVNWTSTWPVLEAGLRASAEALPRPLDPDGRSVLLAAEAKGLFGGFEHHGPTGAVLGRFLRFTHEPGCAVAHVEARQGAGWVRVLARVAPADPGEAAQPYAAGPLFVAGCGSVALTAHDLPGATLALRALGGGEAVTLVLAPGVEAELLAPRVAALRGAAEGLLVLPGPGRLVLAGGALTAELAPGGSAVLQLGQPPSQHPPGGAAAALARALASGDLAAELAVVAAPGGGIGETLVPYGAVRLRVTGASPGSVGVEVAGEASGGKAVVLRVDDALLRGPALEVLFDGLPALPALDLADALRHEPGEGPEAYVASGAGGVEVVVQVPAFSVHSIHLREMAGPAAGLGLAAALALLAGLAALMLRKDRFL